MIKDVVQDYGEVLDDFKRYCKTSVLEAVSEYNEDCGGIPEVFRWAFYGSEEDDFEPSPEAEAAISKDREDWAQTQSGRHRPLRSRRNHSHRGGWTRCIL